ncbi:MAG: lysozyme inhibitor LprI family protein [Ruegeria sp.]|uniref:lysozyme inhibitor LprI family protein n=1 Tax=Ruegeria sp. TaxID=1879320 RepID=UPI00349EB49B
MKSGFKLRMTFAVVVVLLSQNVAAQEQESPHFLEDVRVIEECLSALQPFLTQPLTLANGHCENVVANGCQATSQYNDTPAIVRCITRELGAFERIMEHSLERAAKAVRNFGTYEEFGLQAERKLRRAQLAWLEYRDNHCELAGDSTSPGTIHSVRRVGCRSRMTADRVLYLRGLFLGYNMERY